jgi:HEAT repeat protein
MNKLKALHHGDLGVVEVVACGNRATPALRALLFEREPSGLYQVRCRAVEALAALSAHDALIDFLRATREATDPVERLGDDALINAAALALAQVRKESVFQLLFGLLKRRPLAGVISAVGRFRRAETIPYLVDALAEDDCHLATASALRKFSSAAHPALLEAVNQRLPSPEYESISSLRRRRRALELLAESGVQQKDWPKLRLLMWDTDQQIVWFTCNICLTSGPASEKGEAIRRLNELLADQTERL